MKLPCQALCSLPEFWKVSVRMARNRPGYIAFPNLSCTLDLSIHFSLLFFLWTTVSSVPM